MTETATPEPEPDAPLPEPEEDAPEPDCIDPDDPANT